VWKVPIDHGIFDDISPSQWLWYFHQIRKDEEEEFNIKSDFADYIASFIAPEQVKKVRESREISKQKSEHDPIAGKFVAEKPENVDLDNIQNMLDMIKYDEERKQDKSKNYKYWAEIDLG